MSEEERIFIEAFELPPEARPDFLTRACGADVDLRSRVERLLRGHDSSAGFLEPPWNWRPRRWPEEKPGDTIGRYVLVRKVGEGGCGVVYLAEQATPVRRRVALKVIKLGMDTKAVIKRFEAERQTLAVMDHPDIAKVFDAGATETGRPFFVMEFVEGVPITRFCDENSLPMGARLELFGRVCRAIQHAHQKGIIHRDLKPSNILVTRNEGAPAPKVIDFGVAKATQGSLAEQTLLTRVDQFIGTPAYMSPEQAEMRDLDIDTRSDIYSLGVLLYELLTGLPPFDPKSLVEAGIDEIRRIIREVDPPRPSIRVSTLNDADRQTVARLRKAAPMHLRSALTGDLDWIVMRCLEKERGRRYGTAQELGADIGRYLRSEPVFARPPEAVYRFRKFVVRNRLGCASGAAIALALVAGTVVSVRQAVRATRAEHAAQAERDAAIAARAAEVLARQDAQRRREQAEDLLTFMLGSFRDELKKAGRLAVLDRVGDKAMAYFAGLSAAELTDSALAHQARALRQIGEIRVEEARYTDAAAAVASAFERASALAARHPENADMLFERAQAEYWTAFIDLRRGDMVRAQSGFVRYRDSAQQLLKVEGPTFRARREVTYGLHNLAVLDFDQDRFERARIGFLAERETLQGMIRDASADLSLRSDFVDDFGWLAMIAEHTGRLEESLPLYASEISGFEDLERREPGTDYWRFRVADSIGLRTGILIGLGRLGQAGVALDRAGALLARLVAGDEDNKHWKAGLAYHEVQRAMVRMAAADPEGAADALKRGREAYAALVAAEPLEHGYRQGYAEALGLEAVLRLKAGRPGAGEVCAQCVSLAEALVRESPGDDRAVGTLAGAYVLQGWISRRATDSAGARRGGLRALEVLGPRSAADSLNWRLLDPEARALLLVGRTADARAMIAGLTSRGYRPILPWSFGAP